jgi:hypothetical protein
MAGVEKSLAIFVGNLTNAGDRMGVSRHQRERLVTAPLACPQTSNRLVVLGIAGQVESSKPFDGDYLPLAQEAAHFPHRFKIRLTLISLDVRNRGKGSAGINQQNPGAANRTGIRLCVESAVAGIVVFRLAVGAHLELAHRSFRAVIGDVLNDAVARSAIGAVSKRIAEAPIAGVREFPPAIVAGRNIGRNEDRFEVSFDAFADRKLCFTQLLNVPSGNTRNFSQRRRFTDEVLKKIGKWDVRAFRFNQNAVRRVEHEPGQVKSARQVVDERAKTHSLHDSSDMDSFSLPDRQKVPNAA